ncbi:MAG: hypothetical protein AAFP19_17490 [Bacteroidota bacterium]
MEVRLIKREDIDKTKWNSCVHFAGNGNIFAYQWYLKNTTENEWDGLVEGDYESVMPLIWQKRFPSRKELYVPDMIREAGIYSIHLLSKRRIQKFIEAIPEQYGAQRIHLNQGGMMPDLQAYKSTVHPNYLLFLQDIYEDISQNFNSHIREEIEKAETYRLMPISSMRPEKIANFYKRHSQRKKGLEKRYHAYLRIMYNALHRGWGFASGIVNRQQELCATCFFIYSHNKAMALLPAASPEGKQHGALAYMIDLFIRSHAGRPTILDFNSYRSEWSTALLKGFGAIEGSFVQLDKKGKWWF